MSASPQRTFAEFFAGIGLMRLGLERAGWKIAYANDICPGKFEMYRANFEDADDHFVVEDIHDVLAADVPTVLLATASFPCNDLSLAGARAGLKGSQSSAFYGFARILREMRCRRPRFILVENVSGLLSSNDGKDFREVMLTLNKLGYSVDPFIIDASHFVPQSRQRLFIVGELRSDSALKAEDRAEAAEFYQSEIRPRALAEFVFNNPDIDWRLRELPKLPQSLRRLISILEDLPHNRSEWWNEKRTAYLLNQMSQRHRILVDKMIDAAGWSFGTVFRRVRAGRSMAELRVDGIAGCLRTPRGGSGRQILVKAGFGEFHARLLTPKECARLMGANDFTISGSLNQALFGFGDAVCVPVIHWIAQHYLEARIQESRELYADGDKRAYG
ncbi:MAG: DNA (cytosine-5-)-methyltransferase [Chthoniobacterales bacterium]|nr:MAG: DNA (cytosine-5-)-methyltransferase [Chthoniobacterales bacterium]